MRSFAILPILSLGFLLMFSACAKKKGVAESTQETVNVSIPKPEVEKIIIDQGFVEPAINGRFNVDSWSINGSVLEITVSYSGGCEEHIFRLYTDQKYMKSYPPQLNLFLEHIDNNDRCRAMIIKKLSFDVAGIEYPGTSEIILRLNNSKETISYKY